MSTLVLRESQKLQVWPYPPQSHGPEALPTTTITLRLQGKMRELLEVNSSDESGLVRHDGRQGDNQGNLAHMEAKQKNPGNREF